MARLQQALLKEQNKIFKHQHIKKQTGRQTTKQKLIPFNNQKSEELSSAKTVAPVFFTPLFPIHIGITKRKLRSTTNKEEL